MRCGIDKWAFPLLFISIVLTCYSVYLLVGVWIMAAYICVVGLHELKSPQGFWGVFPHFSRDGNESRLKFDLSGISIAKEWMKGQSECFKDLNWIRDSITFKSHMNIEQIPHCTITTSKPQAQQTGWRFYDAAFVLIDPTQCLGENTIKVASLFTFCSQTLLFICKDLWSNIY